MKSCPIRFSIVKYFLFLSITFFFTKGQTQDFAIENSRENVAHAGIPTYLKCVVNRYASRSVRLTTNNGTITSLEDKPGEFMFIPKQPGQVTITVWVQTGKMKKKIGNYIYRVHTPPPAHVWITSSSDSTIICKTLLTFPLRGMCFPYDCINTSPAIVQSYSVTACKNDSCIFTIHNVGNKLEDANIAKIKTLQAGTVLFFNNIVVQLATGYIQKAEDIRYTISKCEE